MKKWIVFVACLAVSSAFLISCNEDVEDLPQKKAIPEKQIANKNADFSITIDGVSGTLTSAQYLNWLNTEFQDLLSSGESFSVLELLQSEEDEAGQSVYFLKASSDQNQTQVGRIVTTTDGVNLDGNGTKTCTCTGCRNGCELRVQGESCYCTSCSSATNNDCTKTETVTLDSNQGNQ